MTALIKLLDHYREASQSTREKGAMGKHPYTNGLLFLTTSQASSHVTELMKGRDKSVNIVTLTDLEGSQIDWSQYQHNVTPVLNNKKTLRPHQETALNKVKAGLKTVAQCFPMFLYEEEESEA